MIRLLGEHALTSPGPDRQLGAAARQDRARRGLAQGVHERHRGVRRRRPSRTLDETLKDVRIPRARLGPCPVCGHEIVENRKGYSCWAREDPGCGFVIWKAQSRQAAAARGRPRADQDGLHRAGRDRLPRAQRAQLPRAPRAAADRRGQMARRVRRAVGARGRQAARGRGRAGRGRRDGRRRGRGRAERRLSDAAPSRARRAACARMG